MQESRVVLARHVTKQTQRYASVHGPKAQLQQLIKRQLKKALKGLTGSINPAIKQSHVCPQLYWWVEGVC